MSSHEHTDDAFQPTKLQIDDDDALGALVALAGLPNLSPKRLWSLLALDGPAAVWQLVSRGKAPPSGRARDAAHTWPEWCAAVEPRIELERHRRAGVNIAAFGGDSYPERLSDDPEPPAVIFGAGPVTRPVGPCVAIVGTRRCTRYGSDVARDLGRALATAGASVVSGLAAGIDAAAHAGVVEVEPSCAVAVVAGGVDVVYPTSNRGLWQQLVRDGLILSEWPLGARPRAWRFPARNRLVAALSDVVVVVESAAKGGSMYTVDEAIVRHREVVAVPGSIRSPASLGTNRLIADGAHALCSIDEFVEMVVPNVVAPASAQAPVDDNWLLQVIGWEPMGLDQIADISGQSAAMVLLEVERLIAAGRLVRTGGVVQRR